jgi:hypothetical protein
MKNGKSTGLKCIYVVVNNCTELMEEIKSDALNGSYGKRPTLELGHVWAYLNIVMDIRFFFTIGWSS